ncbi:MAG: F0F1 ATP synthase subunit delta [Rubricoccaceae bacterium]|nr:F0F1 ATP synthase subunit delta [Rubricoccaceae bacterium]
MSISVARRYALALYQEANEKGLADRVDADIDALRETLDNSKELQAMFRSPVVSREKKEAIIQQLFEGKIDGMTLNFIRMLVQKQREELLPSVVSAYQMLRDDRLGIVEAFVRTAKPLGDSEKETLRSTLEERSGKTVRMNVDVDSSLLGGLVVRVGDQVYDRSVRHQLKTLRDQFKERVFLSQN